MFDTHHHVHNHYTEAPRNEVLLRSIDLKLDLTNERLDTMARTIDDILAQGQTVLTGVTKNTDLDDSIITMLNAETATLKDLRGQLAAAGTDPAKLEALGTLMDQVAAANDSNAQKKTAAITANTGA